ncbi:MAG: SIS domain-containing protein [Bacteroidales bacterium]|nr:SIS domain-containing protein [Bacteroidales bacterium]
MKPDNYTYREIRQQPSVWKKTYGIVRSRKGEIASFLHRYLEDGYSVVLTGAGTSAYIGDALECALGGTLFEGARSIATTDIITDPSIYFGAKSKVLLVSFARSGNSPESVGAVKSVEKTAGKVAHVFITCSAKGQLAGMKADNILTILLPPETDDKSLAMTSSYSSMLLTCSLISRIDDIEAEEKHIEALSDGVEAAMNRYEDKLREIAGLGFKRAVFLGSGPLKGVAEESRLKLQELTDGTVMCAFDSFVGFRHGPKAVVHDDTLVVYLMSPDPAVRRYEMDLVNQIGSRNAVQGTVMVCRGAAVAAEKAPSLTIETGLPDSMPQRYGIAAYIFVAQLLGTFKSMGLGLNPDTPSVSGNISRVVEGVTLYI